MTLNLFRIPARNVHAHQLITVQAYGVTVAEDIKNLSKRNGTMLSKNLKRQQKI